VPKPDCRQFQFKTPINCPA